MAETSFPRDRIRITLLENAHPAAAEAHTERGYSVEVIPRALEGAELNEVMAASHILGVRSRTKVRDPHLQHAGRMLAIGLTVNMFLYVFINMAMVMGLIPVVGIPLPMISYGGTAMMTVLFGFGLLMSVYVNRDLKIGQRRMSEDS